MFTTTTTTTTTTTITTTRDRGDRYGPIEWAKKTTYGNDTDIPVTVFFYFQSVEVVCSSVLSVYKLR